MKASSTRIRGLSKKRKFVSPFSITNTHPHVAYSNRFCPSLTEHALYDVGHHRVQKIPFSFVHTKMISTISWFYLRKNSTLGTAFENLRFWCPKTPFTCGGKATAEKKLSVSKNIRIRVDGAQVNRR